MESGSTSDQPIMLLPHDMSSHQPYQIPKQIPRQVIQRNLSETDASQRMFNEPTSQFRKEIPFRQPSGYAAQLGKHVEQHKKDLLKASAPSFTKINIAEKGEGSSKFRGTTVSEILDLDPSQPASPESIRAIDTHITQEIAEENTLISKHLPNETHFHFNDSLQVQAQDLSTTSHLERKPRLIRGNPSIPITYDKVWDPFDPLAQRQEGSKEVATLQPYPSRAPTARSMSFSLPSNHTEPNIHNPPTALRSSSLAPEEDPPIPAWKIASQSIVKAPKRPELARLEDCLSEDIAIRAILNGWDSIGESWELPPFWRVIRVLDELIFGKFNPVVRLASLWVVHLLMRYHSDPSPERARDMPKFYNLKGLDFEDDYSIGNFLPWPGIRALAQNPRASFRSDKFFKLETTTLKILWPFSLQDCYTRDPFTGLFKISPSFDKRIYDINAWTFEPKMFENFPELYGVAPAFNSIPGKVDEARKRSWSVMSRDDGDNGRGEVKGKEIEKIGKEVELSVYSRGLKWHKITDKGKEVIYFTFW